MDISKVSSGRPIVMNGLDTPRTVDQTQQPQEVIKQANPAGRQGESDDLGKAVASMASFIQTVQRNLDFSVDDASGEVVIKVVDTDTGKLVRQIPSEEALRLSEKLEELRSLMFETRA